MKIVVIGGRGLIGSPVVSRLRQHGHEVVPAAPVNGVLEIAGPEQFRFDQFIRDSLAARNDPRAVIADPHARYFGTELSERSLVPGAAATLAGTRYADWMSRSTTGGRP